MNSLPQHLKKYIIEQNYLSYSPIDQAVWRHCLKRLKKFLSINAHPCYVDGLEKTGIDLEQIPKISEISKKLEKFGWRALPVSGFIPPAAFMELQSLGILPIAADMRSLDHLLYTPAPDIVHEAAGHAPIVIDPEYAEYLREYSQVAKKAIISIEDLRLYESIRDLSDLKENPNTSVEQVQKAEKSLKEATKSMTFVSEATYLSRMNWWTAEYGLIGDLKNPKIFGAGLLSSIGESEKCLSDHVKKIPLTVDCIFQSYDITEPQPQLFVTPSFKHLSLVLKELSEKMAYKIGGQFGLDKAIQSQSINTIVLESGFQISGQLMNYAKSSSTHSKDSNVTFLKFSGPAQICMNDQEISGHGTSYHNQGFSTPLGEFKNTEFKQGAQCKIEFDSGLTIEGVFSKKVALSPKAIIISIDRALVELNGEILFKPEWGTYDFLTGHKIISVFGGPADRIKFGQTEDFQAKFVPPKPTDNRADLISALYQEVRNLRNRNNFTEAELSNLFLKCCLLELNLQKTHWLLFFEILEIIKDRNFSTDFEHQVRNFISNLALQNKQIAPLVTDALKLIYDANG